MISEQSPDPDVIALADYWDTLVLGQPALPGARHPDPDPGLVAVIDHLHTRDGGLSADAAFVARLRDELTEAWSAEPNALHTIALLSNSPIRLAPLPHLPASAHRPAAPAQHPMGAFAAAALILVTLAAAIVAFGLGGRDTLKLLSRPPADSGPIPAFSDPQSDLGLLTTATMDELPPIAGYVAIERWTYPPHSDPVTTHALSGPMLIFVTSGEVTISLDGLPASLQGRPLGGAQNSVDALFAISRGKVAAGQTLLLPPNTRMTTSNARTTEATVIVVPLNAEREDDWSLPYDQTAVRLELLARSRTVFSSDRASIGLRRAVIAPEETIPPPPADTFQLVGSESKYLGYLGRRPDGSVVNLEKEPLVVLIVTVTQVET